MSDEKEILRQWLTLKEGDGIKKATAASKRLLLVGLLLTIAIAQLIYFDFNSILVALASLAIGWSIAERNALKSRVNLWPKLEKYLNWKLINENLPN